MRYYQGYYLVTYRVPGDDVGKTEKFADSKEIGELAYKCPVGTKVWVMIPSMNIGYGMEVYGIGLMY